MNRKVLCFATAFFLIAALLFPVIAAEEAGAAARPLRVVYGFDREFPPFSFEDPGGKAVGFEVELIEAIFGTTVSLVKRPLQWDMIPTELASGVITLTTGMVKTEERSKLFGFSEYPTFPLQIRLFTKTYNRFPNLTFLRGQRVSVEQGSYQHRLLQNFGGINIKAYPDKTSPLKALFNDDVEAYAGPAQNAYYLMNKLGYSGMTTMGTPLGLTQLRVAVNIDRGDILRMVNQGLRALVETGEYDRIYRKWFVRDLTGDETMKLLNAAKEAVLSSYAPYTRQPRGAAVLTATGQVYQGSAVENANPALAVSAPAAALAGAVRAGDIEIIAVVSVDAGGSPVDLNTEDRNRFLEFGRGVLVMSATENGLLSGEMVGKGLLPGEAAGPKSAL